MIPQGLHSGLAAWIKRQRALDDFTTWPSQPVVINLTNLESVSTRLNLAQADEFVRMVNFTPRKNHYATPFATSDALWESHPALLRRMDFITRPWTPQHEAEWQQALDVLYVTHSDGQRTMSSANQLYEEFRHSYESILNMYPPAPEEAALMLIRWEVEGHRAEIAAARETLYRLQSISWMSRAKGELNNLDSARLAAGTLSGYAPTEFSPLSAMNLDNWFQAEVSLDELEDALSDARPHDQWTAWRAVRNGSVSFHYVVLDLSRPWFTPAVYGADDWRLEQGAIAAAGDGLTGPLPAFVQSVYLVSLDDIRINNNSKPTATRPIADWEIRTKSRKKKSASLVANAEASKIGVVPGAKILNGYVSDIYTPMHSKKLSIHNSEFIGSKKPDSKIDLSDKAKKRQRSIDLHLSRVAFTREYLLLQSDPAFIAPPIGSRKEVEVVGFGCVKLPASPQPNPAYPWTSI